MSERADRRTFDFLAGRRARREPESERPSVSTSGLELVGVFAVRATLDFPNTLAGTSQDLTVTVPGAVLSDVVSLGVPNASVNANSCFTAWVSAANTVTVRHNNYSGAAINPASGTFTIEVKQYK